jgi:hypothetical protein
MAEAVEHETLSSNSSPTKKTQKTKNLYFPFQL